ncbi:MAG TPA: Crp/Fnr family transcriptional regulator [Candidatus Angelobacter sp.]|nr:Crp/Fnr family transcriptional regulator [Candidatus Angelobacter sp.]
MQIVHPQLSPPGGFDELLRGASILAGAEADLTANAFLATIGLGRKIVYVEKQQSLFSQGDAADAVFYIQKGRVKLTVFSAGGKEATLALLGPGDFVGEECVIALRPERIATAVALTPCTLLRIDRGEIIRELHDEKAFADLFVAFLLARNVRIQEDLIDQLFNSSEKRLARTLLLLARSGKKGSLAKTIPQISQETLAEMVGTTRSRVSFFMNRFRKLGYINYKVGCNGVLQIRDSLLNVVLHD